jgi:hypothetical protein
LQEQLHNGLKAHDLQAIGAGELTIIGSGKNVTVVDGDAD